MLQVGSGIDVLNLPQKSAVISENSSDGVVQVQGGFWMCRYCANQYSTRTYVIKHIKTVHLKEKKFVCNFCQNAFSTKQRMISHGKICKMKPSYE